MTRLKENADYGVVKKLAVPQGRGVRHDEVIFFYKLAKAGIDAYFRRIEFYDEENGYPTRGIGWPWRNSRDIEEKRY